MSEQLGRLGRFGGGGAHLARILFVYRACLGDLLGVLVIYTDEVGLGFLIQELDDRAYRRFFFFFPSSPFARYQHLMEAHRILLVLILSVKGLLK